MAKPKVEVINDLLGYEGLKIIQRPDIFNFSLDSTLLANFVTINKGDKLIVDLGCGNGYIPIFLTLRTKAKIIGVEIQEEIYDLAKRSVSYNGLDEQITIYHDDLKTIHKKIGSSIYDVVTCNPPFFKYNDSSNINESIYQTIARHEVMATLDDIVKTSNILLKDKGTLALVHRAERLIDVIDVLKKYNFALKRLQFVYSKKKAQSALAILIEAKKKGSNGGLKILPPLYVYNEKNEYTKEILAIFNYKKENTNVKKTKDLSK